jgi:hypothetical protein
VYSEWRTRTWLAVPRTIPGADFPGWLSNNTASGVVKFHGAARSPGSAALAWPTSSHRLGGLHSAKDALPAVTGDRSGRDVPDIRSWARVTPKAKRRTVVAKRDAGTCAVEVRAALVWVRVTERVARLARRRPPKMAGLDGGQTRPRTSRARRLSSGACEPAHRREQMQAREVTNGQFQPDDREAEGAVAAPGRADRVGRDADGRGRAGRRLVEQRRPSITQLPPCRGCGPDRRIGAGSGPRVRVGSPRGTSEANLGHRGGDRSAGRGHGPGHAPGGRRSYRGRRESTGLRHSGRRTRGQPAGVGHEMPAHHQSDQRRWTDHDGGQPGDPGGRGGLARRAAVGRSERRGGRRGTRPEATARTGGGVGRVELARLRSATGWRRPVERSHRRRAIRRGARPEPRQAGADAGSADQELRPDRDRRSAGPRRPRDRLAGPRRRPGARRRRRTARQALRCVPRAGVPRARPAPARRLRRQRPRPAPFPPSPRCAGSGPGCGTGRGSIEAGRSGGRRGRGRPAAASR